ncbi:MAG TPA: Clp protease N-terminal domain-containing protein [Humisphaera sp.]|jgi:ATP-dependent Clp protease ATP-binding subunit ClpC|nr:Clp protease N-terminal domain-containing protein [Humisphaera sp.]
MKGIWRYFDLSTSTYARFTGRARLVMALADQFAGERHAREITPEHILRGLASGGRGAGRTVLDEMGVDLARLLPELIDLSPLQPIASLPSMSEMASDPAKYFPEMELGPAAVECLAGAKRAAEDMKHNYIGTEHLLLGLLSQDSPAAGFLRERGISFELARSGVCRLLYGA